jgi:hypothetical protein
MFTFEDGVNYNSCISSSAEISAYMAGIDRTWNWAPSAEIRDPSGLWFGKDLHEKYLRKQLAYGDGKVFHTRHSRDFFVIGYQGSNGGIWHPLDFDRSVFSLPKSDEGIESVPIDDADVISNPAPGAILLAIFGLTVVGVKMRKYA